MKRKLTRKKQNARLTKIKNIDIIKNVSVYASTCFSKTRKLITICSFHFLRRFKMKKAYGNAITTLVVFATALLLAACGGGGGGSSSSGTPVTVTVTCPDGVTKETAGTTEDANGKCPLLTITSSVAPNSSSATPDSLMSQGITLSANGTLDTGTISVSMSKGTSSSLNPTPVEITISFSTDKKSVTAKTTSLAQYAQPYFVVIDGKDTAGNSVHYTLDFKTANLSCTAPKVVSSDGTACVDAVLHYTEKVYAIWTMGYPYAVTKTGVTKVPNHTSWNSSSYYAPLANCGMALDTAYLSQTGGKILVSCQAAPTGDRHIFYIDPSRNDGLYDYTGPVPAGIVWTYVTPIHTDHLGWGSYVKVSNGYFFVYDYESWVLNFQDNAGIVSTIKAGTFDADGNIDLLAVYSN